MLGRFQLSDAREPLHGQGEERLQRPHRQGESRKLCQDPCQNDRQPEGSSQYGENAFFYESAEGVLAAVVMLLAEFILPEKDGTEKRHIVSAFKLVQDLLAAPAADGERTDFMC